MENNNFLLDDDAAQLFQELDGLDAGQPRVSASEYTDMLSRNLGEEQKRLDAWRILLIELIALLTSYFKNVHLWQRGKLEKEFFGQLADIFAKLVQKPGNDGTIFIRYRGFKAGTITSGTADYIMIFGDLIVDLTTTLPALMKRQGIGASHLRGKLFKSFEVLSEYEINNLYIKLPNQDPQETENVWTSIRILTRYYQAIKTDSVITLKKDGSRSSFPVVYNEKNQPDANLTLVAGLNRLKPQAIKSLIQKVFEWMQQVAIKASREQLISVYNSLYTIKNFKEKLIQPPIEVNNVKWLIVDRNQEIVSKKRAQVAGFIAESFHGTPMDISRMINSVYGNDFEKLDSQNLGDRLLDATNLLDTIEEKTEDQQIEDEVLNNIKGRIDEVRGEVFDDIDVKDDMITVRMGEHVTALGRINEKLYQVVSFFKERHNTRKKMKNLVNQVIDFDAQDYQMLSEDFEISVADAKTLIQLLKRCFDSQGNFFRGVFEKHIPEFVKYENRVFEFLWYYLKQTCQCNTRVAFLNSLLLLIVKLEQPIKAMKILLSDFYRESAKTDFTDRNALMLSNLLVRKYNKETNFNIEITPEEVLFIQNGLNEEVIQTSEFMLETDKENFFGKIKTIHQKLLKALHPSNAETKPMPLRFLFSLERECYIFLSVVGGNTALSVIRSALKEYADPESEIYQLKKSSHQMGVFLQHLRILVRGLGRIGDAKDLHLIEKIKINEAGFMERVKTHENEELVKRIMEWVDKSRSNIIRMS